MKQFESEADYNAFKSSENFVKPNFSFISGTKKTYYTPDFSVPIGTVCYYNTSEKHLKFCSVSEYNSANGPAVGVVAVPNNCTPDGSVRIISVKGCTSGGTTAGTENVIAWGGYEIETPLPNLTSVPTWSNSSGSTSGYNSYGYAPSDKFSAVSCYGNPSVFYGDASWTPFIPPILTSADTPNPDCLVEIGSPNTNCLRDFDGAGNTAVLVGLGTAYTAANACAKYSVDGLETGWYLPACGELVYILPKFNVLNSVLSSLGGASLVSNGYWSSSEYSSYCARHVDTNYGGIGYDSKYGEFYVRPFARVVVSPLCF